MIRVVIYEKEGYHVGIKCKGHAGYAEQGEDLVCCAASVLVLNTINSIQMLTKVDFDEFSHEEKGEVEFFIKSKPNEKTQLLFESLVIGLETVSDEVDGKYISIKFEEV